MSEIKTQEEFEAKINDLVDKINNAPSSLISDDLLELWDDCREAVHFYSENGYGPIYTELRAIPENKKFSEILVYIKSEYYLFLELRDNFVYDPMSFFATLSYVCDEYISFKKFLWSRRKRKKKRKSLVIYSVFLI